MKGKLLAVLLAACFLGSAVARAEGLTYNNLDVGYKYTDSDEDDVESTDGLEANLTVSPAPNFFLEGGYEYATAEVGPFDVEGHLFRYGIGLYAPVVPEFHLIARGGGLHSDINVDDGPSISDDGYYAGAKFRFDACKAAEIEGGATWEHIEGTEWIYDLAAIIKVTPNVGILAKVQINEDSDYGLVGGVRLSF